MQRDGPSYRLDARLFVSSVQEPRPPIWVAGVAPHTRPLRRAQRFDGFVPIGYPRLQPDELASYVGDAARPGWDVVASRAAGVPSAEYADAGATWLVETMRPIDDWLPEFRSRIAVGLDR